jgi:hypothetical protein
VPIPDPVLPPTLRAGGTDFLPRWQSPGRYVYFTGLIQAVRKLHFAPKWYAPRRRRSIATVLTLLTGVGYPFILRTRYAEYCNRQLPPDCSLSVCGTRSPCPAPLLISHRTIALPIICNPPVSRGPYGPHAAIRSLTVVTMSHCASLR